MNNSVIIGAAGGIGTAITSRLAARGDRVIAIGRNLQSLESLKQKIPKIDIVVADARDRSAIETAVADALKGGELKTILNCAGSVLLKPAHLTTIDEFDDVIGTNLRTAFNAVCVLAKFGGKGASALLISSCAARIGLANHEAIAAAKAGIEGLMRSAAATYAAKGLRFNCIAPGLVRTPLTQAITENAAAAQYSLALHPLKRFGEPNDIAALADFLTNPEHSWITGEVFSVDGGLAMIKTKS